MQADTSATPAAPAIPRSRLLLSGGFALLVLLAATYWGGAANPGPLLYAGVALLIGVIIAFAALTWWLFLSSLPAKRSRPYEAKSTPLVRQTLVVLVIICGGLFAVGGFWDELWHREFNTPFGEDFWWRPHQLIYGSLALGAIFALGGLAYVLREKGDLRRRFRAEPGIALLALVSGYLMFSVPIDPIWHEIYGVDISAWSLPHIMLAMGFTFVMLVAVALQLSLVPRAGWRGLGGLRIQEMLALLPIAWGYLIFTQIATAEWEGLRAIGTDMSVPGFWSRPEWLYPVVVIMVGVFIGAFALHALQRAGAATLLALMVFGLRAIMLGAFGGGSVGLSAQSHLLAALVLVAMDVVYALRLKAADAPLTRIVASLAGAGVMFTLGFLYIHNMMVYPRINAETVPGMLLFGVLMALAAGNAGASLGGWVGALNRDRAIESGETAQATRAALRTGLVLLIAVVLFVAWFAATATPPERWTGG
jgi:hypothetical protein